MHRREILKGAAAAWGLSSLSVMAQGAWPAKPVRIVVLFGAGGASDTLTRFVAEKLNTYFNQSFPVENKTGAGGNIGMLNVMNAAPDGYAIASATIGTLSINQFLYANVGYDPAKDFSYVSRIWENCNVLVVSAEHPAKNMKEFIAWAKEQPKGVTFSSSGIGTTPHLAGELFAKRTGISGVHVPFRTSATIEVIAGTVDFAIDNVASWVPHIRAGKARALAVTAADRWPTLPEVPTMAQAGLPDFVMTSWGAFVMPAGTPPAITAQLSKAIQDILGQPEAKERFLKIGALAVPSTPQETAAFAAAERVKWKEIVRLSGAKLD
jgi:tripartite-type tricarboxylate transporter receptor subunit TctC